VSSLGKAFAFFTGASIIGSFTQVIKGKITAVLLGTEGVGVLNQLTSLWSLFSAVASLGFYNGMLRHLAPAWADDASSYSADYAQPRPAEHPAHPLLRVTNSTGQSLPEPR